VDRAAVLPARSMVGLICSQAGWRFGAEISFANLLRIGRLL
jgi:hypothetical protein